MSNRQFQNFCEYRFKDKNNILCFYPNSATPNFFKSLIIKRNNTQPSYKEDSKLNKGGKDNGKR